MTPYILSKDQRELDDWGTPEDIGATTLEGTVRVSGCMDLGGPECVVFGGLYAATRGSYRTVYAFHEHATLFAGQVKLTDENSGASVVYGPGDSWIIAKGTPVIWSILSDQMCKSYLASTADI